MQWRVLRVEILWTTGRMSEDVFLTFVKLVMLTVKGFSSRVHSWGGFWRRLAPAGQPTFMLWPQRKGFTTGNVLVLEANCRVRDGFRTHWWQKKDCCRQCHRQFRSCSRLIQRSGSLELLIKVDCTPQRISIKGETKPLVNRFLHKIINKQNTINIIILIVMINWNILNHENQLNITLFS